MSFLDHIENCNEHNIEKFVALNICGQRVGWVKHNLLSHFAAFPHFVTCGANDVEINASLNTPLLLSEAMSQIGSTLTESGYTGPWCDERYAIGRRFGENLFELDRAVVPAFGARAYGMHLTGYVRDGSELSIWVPRRTSDRFTYPGKLDNTVAGGQPARLGLFENLEKECAEEANIPSVLTRKARPVGTIGYRLEVAFGLRDDLIFSFDLELPPDFKPTNCDGEGEDFELWPAHQVMSVVESTDDFKFNCNLVLIDFFLRHGLIPSSHPEFSRIYSRLGK